MSTQKPAPVTKAQHKVVAKQTLPTPTHGPHPLGHHPKGGSNASTVLSDSGGSYTSNEQQQKGK